MSPVFAHGQLRLYLLVLLAEAPRHGYEVIQDLETRFGGLYTPSAGTVYPRLAKLEEEGLVERTDEGRKATYRITEAGLAEVRARHREVEDLQADLDQSVRRLAEQVRATVQGHQVLLDLPSRAAGNTFSDGVEHGSVEFRLCGEVPGGHWLDLKLYSVDMKDCIKTIPVALALLGTAWDAAHEMAAESVDLAEGEE